MSEIPCTNYNLESEPRSRCKQDEKKSITFLEDSNDAAFELVKYDQRKRDDGNKMHFL
jgi:hypothetical protein